jgi:hypothetical protein
MTIAETTTANRNDYTGNGVTTVYPFTFIVLEETNQALSRDYTIKVIITESSVESVKQENVDYTVQLNEIGQGTVTFTTAPTASQSITFLSDIPRTQSTDYINIGTDKFPADSHEGTVDKLTLISREQDEKINRAILLSESSNLSNITIPVSTVNADKAIVVNSTGDNLDAKNLADIGTAPVTDFAKTLLDDNNAAEARTTLDAQEDVITTRGDIIRGSSAGEAERLAIGANGQVLSSDGTDVVWANATNNKLIIPISSELTISSGAITITDSRHTIDTESDAATDNLETISGGTAGQILVISTADSARDVVLKHGTGNIITPYSTDITLYSTSDRATLEYDGTNWTVLHTKKPGEIVQVVNYQTGAVASGAGLIPFDNSIPQNTEGAEFMSLAITPKHEDNKLLINVVFVGGETANVDNVFTVALFKDSEANALAACCGSLVTPADQDSVNFCHYMTAGSTSAITFKVRAGKRLSGNMYINGSPITGGQMYGGVAASSITITEIQV